MPENFQSTFLGIKHVRTSKQLGPAAARNHAVRAAEGEYLIWLDSDDELALDAVQALTDKAKEGNYPLVISQLEFRDGETVLQRDPARYIELAREYSGTRYDPLAQTVFSISAQLVHKDLFWQVGGFREDFRYAEMTDLFLRLVGRAGIDRVGVTDSVGYIYNRRSTTLSSNREQMLMYRKRALWDYVQDNINFDPGEYLKSIRSLGRSAVSGMQHFQLETNKNLIVPPWLEEFGEVVPD